MMSWVSLTTPNGYGECALDDVVSIVENMTAWLREHKLEPELSEERWVRQILHYILARHRGAAPWAVNTTHVPEKPTGWTDQDETYWSDWVNYTFSLREWEKRVLKPVFGSDQRLWEVNIEEWRIEIHMFLPMWISRKMSIVKAMYPHEDSDEEEEPETDARGSLLRMRDPKAIDPYILEQEEKKYRGRR